MLSSSFARRFWDSIIYCCLTRRRVKRVRPRAKELAFTATSASTACHSAVRIYIFTSFRLCICIRSCCQSFFSLPRTDETFTIYKTDCYTVYRAFTRVFQLYNFTHCVDGPFRDLFRSLRSCVKILYTHQRQRSITPTQRLYKSGVYKSSIFACRIKETKVKTRATTKKAPKTRAPG